jgi:hypothetical protein
MPYGLEAGLEAEPEAADFIKLAEFLNFSSL